MGFCVISFKSSIRAQDTRAYELVVHEELEISEISENGLNEGDELISGEVYKLLCFYCRGSAQSILRMVEDFRGLVAWQKLHSVQSIDCWSYHTGARRSYPAAVCD